MAGVCSGPSSWLALAGHSLCLWSSQTICSALRSTHLSNFVESCHRLNLKLCTA